MWKKASHIFLAAPLLAIMMGYCQSQHHYACTNWNRYIKFYAGHGRVLVFEEAYYGSESGLQVCGTDRRGQPSCPLQVVGPVLNYRCFGKDVCIVPVSSRALGSRCGDPTRHLIWTAPLEVPERSAQKLCEAREMEAAADKGYIFVFGHQDHDCKISFGQGPSDELYLFFVNYYLIKTQLVQCGNSLYISKRGVQEASGVPCSTPHMFVPQYTYGLSLSGRITLTVRQHALDLGFGFLLEYTVTSSTTTVTEMPVLPPPVESTEPTFYTVSPGPLDGNMTTLTLPDAGITLFVKRDDTPVITEKDHRTIIIVVCMIILVAIITTTVVVFFVVKRLRKNVKHHDEVQHAVQSLAYRPSLERNRYGDLPAPTPDVIRRAESSLPIVTTTDSNSPTPIQSISPAPIQSSSPTQRETNPPTIRLASGSILITENELYSNNEVLPGTDTAIHGLPADTDPSIAHGPPLVPPQANIEYPYTALQVSPYVNEKFEHGPSVDRSTRPDRRSVITPAGSLTPVQVPDTPPPPYLQVDPNGPTMDADVAHIIAALALSNGGYSPYSNI